MSSSRSLIRFFGPALLFAPSGSRAIASSHCSVSYGPSSLLKAKISFSPRPPERSIPPSKMHFILRIKYIFFEGSYQGSVGVGEEHGPTLREEHLPQRLAGPRNVDCDDVVLAASSVAICIQLLLERCDFSIILAISASFWQPCDVLLIFCEDRRRGVRRCASLPYRILSIQRSFLRLSAHAI